MPDVECDKRIEDVQNADNANCVDYVGLAVIMTNEDCGNKLQNVQNVDYANGVRNLSDVELRWTSFIDGV